MSILSWIGMKSSYEVKWRDEKVLVTQSSLTLCEPLDCGPSDSSVHGLSRQENWSGLSFPSPRDLPNPGTEPGSPALQADSLSSEPQGKPMMSLYAYDIIIQKLEYIIYLRYYTIHKNPATCNSYSQFFSLPVVQIHFLFLNEYSCFIMFQV